MPLLTLNAVLERLKSEVKEKLVKFKFWRIYPSGSFGEIDCLEYNQLTELILTSVVVEHFWFTDDDTVLNIAFVHGGSLVKQLDNQIKRTKE